MRLEICEIRGLSTDHHTSLAPYIKQYMPGLAKALKPVAAFYTHLAGYRQMGLKYDDLIVEESATVQKVSQYSTFPQ